MQRSRQLANYVKTTIEIDFRATLKTDSPMIKQALRRPFCKNMLQTFHQLFHIYESALENLHKYIQRDI